MQIIRSWSNPHDPEDDPPPIFQFTISKQTNKETFSVQSDVSLEDAIAKAIEMGLVIPS